MIDSISKQRMLDGKIAQASLLFHGKADSDSSVSQIANMQHTRRCTRHHGVLMPECPSQ